jgi:hypothetical protein
MGNLELIWTGPGSAASGLRPRSVTAICYAISMYLRSISGAALVVAVLLGHISDTTTGQPLVGVHVSVAGPVSAKAVTDSNGSYTIRGLKSGTYTLTLTSRDVPTVHHRVTVSGSTTTANFKACSTTLDYSCGGNGPAGGPG